MPELTWQLLLGITGLTLGLMALISGIALLRRYLQRPTPDSTGSGWTMDKVKSLHESGQLTDKQYERLRDEVIKAMEKNSRGKGPGK